MKKQLLKAILLCWAVMLGVVAFAQSTPGGVQGAGLWLRADRGVTYDPSTMKISQWLDQSSLQQRAYPMTNELFLKDPIGGTYDIDPAKLSLNWANKQPAVQFDGASSFLTDSIRNWKQIYIVLSWGAKVGQSALAVWGHWSSFGGGDNHIFHLSSTGDLQTRYWWWNVPMQSSYLMNEGSKSINVDSIVKNGLASPHLDVWSRKSDTTYSMNQQGWTTYEWMEPTWQRFPGLTTTNASVGRFDGKLRLGVSRNKDKSVWDTTTFINQGRGSYAMKGYIAEVIGFDRLLTGDEAERIESYLAMKYGTKLASSSDKTVASNSAKKDYLLSDGTVIWAEKTDPTLSEYSNYLSFMVRDDQSDLHLTQAQPSAYVEKRSNATQDPESAAVIQAAKPRVGEKFNTNNNFEITHGGNFNTPKPFDQDKSFLIFGRETKENAYSSIVRSVDGACKVVWDLAFLAKSSSAVDTFSMRFEIQPALSKFLRAGAGILMVDGATETFYPGTTVDTTLTVNNILAKDNAKYYVVLGTPAISISTTKLVITETQSAPVTVNVPFTPDTSTVYGFSFDNKSFKYSSTSNQFDVSAIMSADGGVTFDTLANGRRLLYVRLISNEGCLQGNDNLIDSLLFTKKSDSETAYPGGVKGSVFWLRADAGVTVDNNNVITNWEDQSGTQQAVIWHNPDLTTKTYHARLVQNGIGGRPSIDFGAATSVKGTQNVHYKQIFAVQTFTGLEGQFLAFTRRDGKNHKKNCWLWSLSQSRNMGSEYGNTGGTGLSYPYFRLFSQGTAAENYSDPMLQMAITNPSEAALADPVYADSLLTNCNSQTTTWSTTGIFVAINGAYPKFANTTFGWTKFDGVIYIGGLITTTNAFQPRYFGQLSEFIAFDRVLTETECTKVESYLAMKYGLSLYRPKAYLSYRNNGKDNIAFRDYVLSDGTVAWSGGDATLNPYVQYFNFLLNDTISKVNVNKSVPTKVADQNWSTAVDFVSYYDNNVTLVNGSNFDQPKAVPNGGYAIMGANRSPADSTGVFAAPDHNYIIWGRGYQIMTKLVDTVSMQVRPVAGLKQNLETADRLSIIAEYPDFSVKFFKPRERAVGDTCYTFNAIDVVPHTKLYLAFAYAPDFVKCFRDTAFQVFEGLDSTAVYSENAPGGWFRPTRDNFGYNEVTYTIDTVVTMKLVKVLPPYQVSSKLSVTFPVMKQNQTTRVVAQPINGGTAPEVYFSVNADTLGQVMYHDTLAVKSVDNHCVIEAFNQLHVGENTVYVKTFSSEACVDYALVESDTVNYNYGLDSMKLTVEEGIMPARPGGVPGIKLWLSSENAIYNDQGVMTGWTDKSEANQTMTLRQVGTGTSNTKRYSWANYNDVPQFNGYEAYQGSVPFAHRAIYLVSDWNGASPLDPGNVSTATFSVNEAKFPTTNYRDSLAYDPVYRAANPTRKYNQERWLFDYTSSYRLTFKDGLHDSGRGYDFFNGTAPAYTAYWGGVPTMNVLYTLTDTTMFPNWIMKTNGGQRGEIVNYLRTMYGYPIMGACATSASDALDKGYVGRMGEVIATDRALSRNENTQIESYLAMKYGLSVYGDITSDRQFILSDGHVAWDGNDYDKANMNMRDTLAWSYAYMLYIGRDDISTLDVRKSRVVGNYNQTGHKVIAIANGSDFTAPEPLKRDLSYLIMGSPTQAKSSYPKIPFDNGINSYKTQVLKQKNKNDEVIFLDIWCKTYKTRNSGVDRISVEITPDQQYWIGQNKIKSLDKMGIVVNTETDTVFYPAEDGGDVAYVNDIKVMPNMHLNIVLNATNKAIITPNTTLCLGDSLTLTAFTKDGIWSGNGVHKIALIGQVPVARFRAWEAGEGVHRVIYDDRKLNPTIPVDTMYITVKAALSPNVSLTSTRDTFLIGTDKLPIVSVNTDIIGPASTFEFSINDAGFELPLQAESDLNSVEVLGDNLNVGLNRIYAKFRPKMNCILEQDTMIQLNRRLWKVQTTSSKSTEYDLISLYPSPNSGKFNLKNVPVGQYTYAITSANGLEIQGGSLDVQSKDQVIPFNISSAPAGTYYLIIADPKTTKPFKAKGFTKK